MTFGYNTHMPEIISKYSSQQLENLLTARELLLQVDDFAGLSSDNPKVLEAVAEAGVWKYGEERMVFERVGEKLLALDLYPGGNKQIKLTYYYHKILSMLFPNNFPDIHASFVTNFVQNRAAKEGDNIEEVYSGTVRRRVEGKELKHYRYDYKSEDMIRNRIKRVWRGENNVKHPLFKAKTILDRDLKIYPELDLHNVGNILISGSGEMYLDIVERCLGDFDFDVIQDYMIKSNYSPSVIRKAGNCVERINELRGGQGPDEPNPIWMMHMVLG